MFYNKKPKGLNGALQDLGIQFEGREHSGTQKRPLVQINPNPKIKNFISFCCGYPSSGLDDSRNTAQLALRMMRDGCVMKITRNLGRVSGRCPTMNPTS